MIAGETEASGRSVRGGDVPTGAGRYDRMEASASRSQSAKMESLDRSPAMLEVPPALLRAGPTSPGQSSPNAPGRLARSRRRLSTLLGPRAGPVQRAWRPGIERPDDSRPSLRPCPRVVVDEVE